MTTTEYLAAFHTQIDPLTSAAQRCSAWSYVGHQMAAAELGQTPDTDPVPEAVWAYASLFEAMAALSDAGTDPVRIPIPDVTGQQARDLLPHILEQVIAQPGEDDAVTDEELTAFLLIQPRAIHAYTAHTGRLPGSGPQPRAASDHTRPPAA